MRNIMQTIRKFRFAIVVVIGAILTLLAIPNTEKMGDRLQYALPIAGLACSLDAGDAAESVARYATGFASVHFFKNVLPDDGINQRPDGGGNGFPSGHTYAATFGASVIVRECAEKLPYIGTVAIVAAAFTAGSRVEADKHYLFQTFFGALFALFFDRAFRGKFRLASWITSAYTRLKNKVKRLMLR